MPIWPRVVARSADGVVAEAGNAGWAANAIAPNSGISASPFSLTVKTRERWLNIEPPILDLSLAY
jgi:hypothetical protein